MTLEEYEVWYKKIFRRTTSAYIALAMIIADICGALISFGIGFFVINLYDLSIINFRSFVMYWPYLPVFVIVFWTFSLYPGIALAPAEEIKRFTIGSAISFGGIIFSRYIEDAEFDAITAAFFISFIFSTLTFMICRSIMRAILTASKMGGIPAVIYGSGPLAIRLVDTLLENKVLSYIPAVILSEDAGFEEYRGVPVIKDIFLGPILVKKFNLKMAMVAMPELEEKKLSRLLIHSVSAFRYNVMLPSFMNITNIWMNIRDFNGILGFASTNRLRLWWNRAAKRALDLFIVIFGGIVVLPFLLVIALAVKLSSKGPVLYKSKRYLSSGKIIYAYKFRSMFANSGELLRKILEEDPEKRAEWEQNRKIKDDPRVTKIGSFLRKTSLDEFPQIINVLKGEMSLVGPRPPLDGDEVKKFGDNFNLIFSTLPGMTGIWQVSGRSDTDYFDRVSFDTYYLQSWSVWLDLWVLYRTAMVVFRGKGAY